MPTDKFVGRDREMNQLSIALNGALDGRGRVVMLTGDPGIGKTRAAQELAALASEKGAQVLWGRCYEGGGAPPYWPWVQRSGNTWPIATKKPSRERWAAQPLLLSRLCRK
jgi:predicted ATPase